MVREGGREFPDNAHEYQVTVGRTLGYTLILLCILALSAGCAKKENPDEARIKTAVAKYNVALVQAYKDQFFEPLKEVADEETVKKVAAVISVYLQTGQIMDSELLRIDFKEIRVEGDKSTVRTYEKWKYRWLDYRTNREVEPIKDIHYEMLYHLIRKGDGWIVEGVKQIK